jgi:hypothetical protein
MFLTRFYPMQFPPVSQSDKHPDAEEISKHRGDTVEECNIAAGIPKQACDVCIE